MHENRFTGLSEIYSKYRPSYPSEMMDYLYSSEIGMTSSSIVADIGAGTGKLSKLLLLRGSFVYCVEPNDDMRTAGEIELKDFDNFKYLKCSAENTSLLSGSVDFVTAAQSFHWFDREAFKIECRRILGKNGLVVLIWNSRQAKNPAVLENDEICRKHCPEYSLKKETMRGGVPEDFIGFFRGEFDYRVFANNISYNLDAFIGRSLSSSYSPKKDMPSYDHFIADLTEFFGRHEKNGIFDFPQVTQIYIGSV